MCGIEEIFGKPPEPVKELEEWTEEVGDGHPSTYDTWMSMLPMVGKRLRYADEKIRKADNKLQEWCDKLEMVTRLRKRESMRETIIEVFSAL